MLCLKHSFLGNGGIKHPEADDLRFTDMFVSFNLSMLVTYITNKKIITLIIVLPGSTRL